MLIPALTRLNCVRTNRGSSDALSLDQSVRGPQSRLQLSAQGTGTLCQQRGCVLELLTQLARDTPAGAAKGLLLTLALLRAAAGPPAALHVPGRAAANNGAAVTAGKAPAAGGDASTGAVAATPPQGFGPAAAQALLLRVLAALSFVAASAAAAAKPASQKLGGLITTNRLLIWYNGEDGAPKAGEILAVATLGPLFWALGFAFAAAAAYTLLAGKRRSLLRRAAAIGAAGAVITAAAVEALGSEIGNALAQTPLAAPLIILQVRLPCILPPHHLQRVPTARFEHVTDADNSAHAQRASTGGTAPGRMKIVACRSPGACSTPPPPPSRACKRFYSDSSCHIIQYQAIAVTYACRSFGSCLCRRCRCRQSRCWSPSAPPPLCSAFWRHRRRCGSRLVSRHPASSRWQHRGEGGENPKTLNPKPSPIQVLVETLGRLHSRCCIVCGGCPALPKSTLCRMWLAHLPLVELLPPILQWSAKRARPRRVVAFFCNELSPTTEGCSKRQLKSAGFLCSGAPAALSRGMRGAALSCDQYDK